MKKYSLQLLVICLVACNNSSTSISGNNDSSSDGVTQNTNTAYTDYSGCYRQVIGRDSILLQLNQNNDQFTGKMEFDNFEKDASHGTVKGHLENGNIILWYNFSSEGLQSVMEVILKPVSSGMVRAISDITNRGDTALLRHDKLNFEPSNTLIKSDCSEWK